MSSLLGNYFGKSEFSTKVSGRLLDDLMLKDFMRKFFGDIDITRMLTHNMEDIKYRNNVIADLLEHKDIFRLLEKLCSCTGNLLDIRTFADPKEHPLQTLGSFSTLKEYFDILCTTGECIEENKNSLKSEGLKALSHKIAEILDQKFSCNFADAWDKYAKGLDKIGSFTYGFYFDDDLRLSSYSLIAVHEGKYKRSLFSKSTGKIDEMELPCKLSDIMPLKGDDRHAISFDVDPSKELNIYQLLKVASNELLKEQVMLSKNQFTNFIRELIASVRSIYADVLFYVGAVRYAERIISAGLPVCFAEIAAPDEKIFSARNLYHPAMIEYKDDVKEIVLNDIEFSKGGGILILTGPNQGGKTTFLRSVGSIQFLFQLGLPIPAENACISPAEAIVSAFSQEENTMFRSGKLGQELNAIREAIELSPVNSLILFNEPITGTSPMESLILSRKILAVLKVNGYREIWVTHLFELAESIETINSNLDGSALSSLIVTMSENSELPSYKVVRGKPIGKSYAREIFDRENIFEQDASG